MVSKYDREGQIAEKGCPNVRVLAMQSPKEKTSRRRRAGHERRMGR